MTTVIINRPNLIIRTNNANTVGPAGPQGIQGPTGSAFVPVIVNLNPFTPLSSQTVLLCNYPGSLTINLPAAASRSTIITIKDISGAADVNNITVLPYGAELIDGAASDVLTMAYQSRSYIPGTSAYHIM